MMNSNKPIKPPPKPGQVKVYKALYDYKAQRPDELSFGEGDIIYITDMIKDVNWFKATSSDGKTGLVPSNYIEESAENVPNPMHEAAKRGNYDMIKECLKNNVSTHSLDKAGNTPLHWAAYGGHVDCAKILLESSKLVINLQNKLGDTPLMNASYKNHSDVLQLLIDNGARLDILNNEKKSAYDLTLDPKCKVLTEYKIDKNALLQENSEYLDNDDENSD